MSNVLYILIYVDNLLFSFIKCLGIFHNLLASTVKVNNRPIRVLGGSIVMICIIFRI